MNRSSSPEELMAAAGGRPEMYRPNDGRAADPLQKRRDHEAAPQAANGQDAEAEVRPPAYSDEALALLFSARHKDRLRYVAAFNRWMIREPAVWRPDETLRALDLAREVCREAAAAYGDPRGASAVASAKTVSAVERLARADRRHAATADQWDADPWLLNTPAGVVDLQTGHTRPHRPGDMFTKMTAVAPGGGCPRWMSFLDEITCGDKDFVAYLQRFIGYTLTGVIRDHAFAFLWGPGGNGKSVLLGTVAAMLGDYSITAMPDVFTLTRNEQHATNVAALRGARMVVVPETEEGNPWAESRIKSLTGGDRVSARIMRSDTFQFNPQFKLWIAGNHRPVLRNPGPAMRRRLHLMPMLYVPAKPDPELPEALTAELPGILAWAIQGCLDWQREGLNPPEAVTSATSAYFAEEDLIAEWVGERCESLPMARTPARRAFSDWKQWATKRGEDPGTEKRFSAELERHFAKKKTKTGREFLGLRLRPSETGAF